MSQQNLPVAHADVVSALIAIQHSIYQSPFERTETLGKWTGKQVYLKLENLQMTGSFKERGALNRLLKLRPEERSRGVITASAGNHAQGVAFHATRLGIRSTIVMPETTPLIKVVSTRELGGDVILHGTSYDDAYAHACNLCEERALVFVHPFDDPAVIAGQGTIGLEMQQQVPDIEAVVVPVGGGGLISGIAVAMKESNPRVTVIGVEAEAFPSMQASIQAGTITSIRGGHHTIADGIATKRVGDNTFAIVQKYVDEVVTVSEEEIANAILILIEREKSVVEGAGATTLVALINNRFHTDARKIGLVLSGGNIDVNMVSDIIERGLVKDGRRIRLQIILPDVPGALHRVAGIICECRANIIQVHHDREFSDAPIGQAELHLTLETRGDEHIREIVSALKDRGYPVKRNTAALNDSE